MVEVADVHLRRLQSIQNAAARLVSGIRRRDDHITPVLTTLHWLPVPVRDRVTLTTTVLVWKCLHGVIWLITCIIVCSSCLS